MIVIKGPELKLDGGSAGLIFSTREDKGKIDFIWFTSYALNTKRRTASSSMSGHGNAPLVKISTQHIPNA
jgi:hypothetical protein